MPILMTAVLSLAIAWLRGAPPTALASVRLRFLPLPVVAFLIQSTTFVRLESVLEPVAPLLHAISLLLMATFLLANLHYRALALVGVGLALNVVVIGANGGYMPVDPAAAERAGFGQIAARLRTEGTFQKSVSMTESTRFPFLADVIHLPLPNGPDRLISVGDVFIAAGTFLFIQEAMVTRKRARAMRQDVPVAAFGAA